MTTCKHRCKNKQTCAHECCKTQLETNPADGGEPVLGPGAFTPEKQLTASAKRKLELLSDEHKKALLAELLHPDVEEPKSMKKRKKKKRRTETESSDDDTDASDNNDDNRETKIARSLSASQMRRDAAKSIPLLEQTVRIGPVMDYIHACGVQRAGDDYNPAVSAAMTRTTCQTVKTTCLPFVARERVGHDDWKSLVHQFFSENYGKRFLAAARREWDDMAQKKNESSDAYAERTIRMLQGYEYTATLMGRPVTEDKFTFTAKWIDGLHQRLKEGVSLKCGEDPTIAAARLAARRLEKAASTSDDRSSELKRKISELESQIKEQKKAAGRAPSHADLIAMVSPMVEQRVLAITQARHQASYQQPQYPQYAPGPPATPPPATTPPSTTMGPPPTKTGIPLMLQACAMHYNSKTGCKHERCSRSHNVPSGELPPQGSCYPYFYYGNCKIGARCRFQHNDKHPMAKN